MQESTIWWLLAGALVAAELLTGTFYLLMLATGALAAAVAAHAGLAPAVQFFAAALVGTAAVAAWHLAGRHRRQANPDLHLDVGETVLIEHWAPDGTAAVKYRGAAWTAVHRPGITPRTGMHRVAELVGNRLVVDPV